jgi:hypothetical protein
MAAAMPVRFSGDADASVDFRALPSLPTGRSGAEYAAPDFRARRTVGSPFKCLM